MSPLVCFLTVIFLCSLHSPSAAQSADQSTLTVSSVTSTTGLSTLRAFNRSSENVSATSDQTVAGGTDSATPSNATVPLNGSSTAQSETPPNDGGRASPSAGGTLASDTVTASTMESVSPTTELRPTVAPRGPDGTQSTAASPGLTAAPSKKPAAPTPALTGPAPSTARAAGHASQEPSAIPGQKDSATEKKRQPGKTLGVFIGLAVVLVLVLGLVYLIYNKTQKDDPFSHQRLYDSDPVLSLDVSVEPADRFYGGLTPELSCEGRGDHVASQRALNQAAGEGSNPPSQPQPRDEIQLKPMSESSVKIFL